MIILKYYISFFALFISPHVFFLKLYKNTPSSIVISYGVIFSFLVSWCLFFLFYKLHLPIQILNFINVTIFTCSLIFLAINSKTYHPINLTILVLILVFILSILYHFIFVDGIGFRKWDAVFSWNRWAVELAYNKYRPPGVVYPILYPAIWSLFYKLQGSTEIWWTSQFSLFVTPLYIITLLTLLYANTRNVVYLTILALTTPYFFRAHAYSGYMDIPVMFFGLCSLILLYTAEQMEETDYHMPYIYLGLFFSGLSVCTKQAGFGFLLFSFFYILIKKDKILFDYKLLYVLSIITGLYFSYLYIFFETFGRFSTQFFIGNLGYLINHSHELQRKYIFLGDYWHIIYGFFFVLITTLSIRYKKYFKPENFNTLNLIFLILGFLIWSYAFSYDNRNSFWVQSFLIMFVAINSSELIKLFISKVAFIDNFEILNKQTKYFPWIFLITCISMYFVFSNLDDKFAHIIQNLNSWDSTEPMWSSILKNL